MVTLAGKVGVTFIVISFEMAGLPDTHVAVEVITTVTILPLASDDEAKVGLFEPVLIPLTFHW